MSFLQIPKFYIPQSTHILTTDEEIKAHTRPLQFCPVCHYVLCSCTGCHSQECHEPCSYETDEES